MHRDEHGVLEEQEEGQSLESGPKRVQGTTVLTSETPLLHEEPWWGIADVMNVTKPSTGWALGNVHRCPVMASSIPPGITGGVQPDVKTKISLGIVNKSSDGFSPISGVKTRGSFLKATDIA